MLTSAESSFERWSKPTSGCWDRPAAASSTWRPPELDVQLSSGALKQDTGVKAEDLFTNNFVPS